MTKIITPTDEQIAMFALRGSMSLPLGEVRNPELDATFIDLSELTKKAEEEIRLNRALDVYITDEPKPDETPFATPAYYLDKTLFKLGEGFLATLHIASQRLERSALIRSRRVHVINTKAKLMGFEINQGYDPEITNYRVTSKPIYT